MKVLIVGAGPTGLTAALELARRGLDCRIVEKNSGPSTLSKAVGIMPVSVELLMPSGVGEKLKAEAMHFRKLHFHEDGERLMYIEFPEGKNPGDMILGLAQDRTEALMAETLAELGIHVDYGIEVVSVEPETGNVKFSDDTTLTYDWVIGADGTRSTVRQSTGIDFVGYDLPGKWSIADVDLNGGYDPGRFSSWLTSDGNATIIVPIETNRVRLVSSTPDALRSLPLSLDIKRVRRTGTFLIAIRQAATFRKGRVLLAGDAAHCHSPVGGKGMNLGIADAVVLARLIAAGEVDRYDAQRSPVARRVIRATERARRSVQSQHPAGRFMMRLMFKLTDRIPALQTAALRKLTRV